MTRAHRTAHAWLWLALAAALALVIRTGLAVQPGPAPLNDVPEAAAALLETPPATADPDALDFAAPPPEEGRR